MLRHLSNNMRNLLIESLCKKYDDINNKLQAPFTKMYYEEYEIQDMKLQLERIDEILFELRKED